MKSLMPALCALFLGLILGAAFVIFVLGEGNSDSALTTRTPSPSSGSTEVTASAHTDGGLRSMLESAQQREKALRDELRETKKELSLREEEAAELRLEIAKIPSIDEGRTEVKGVTESTLPDGSRIMNLTGANGDAIRVLLDGGFAEFHNAKKAEPLTPAQRAELVSTMFDANQDSNKRTNAMHNLIADPGFTDWHLIDSLKNDGDKNVASSARVQSTQHAPAATGYLVTGVVASGQAQKAGIIEGDIIVSYNNMKLTADGDISRAKATLPEGQFGTMIVNRYGSILSYPIQSGTIGVHGNMVYSK